MRRENVLAFVVTAGAVASIAGAQDFGDRDTGTTIREDSTVSAGIVAFAGGQWDVINADGHAEVPISPFDNQMFVDIGHIQTDAGQADMVQAAWSEVVLPNGRFVEFTWRTENGNQFVPFAAQLNGNPIQAYSYEVGGNGNGVDFRHWVTDVKWEELTISYSFDGGQTVFSDPTIIDPIGGSSWDGTDEMHLGLAFPGDGVNWIRASYTVDVIPAPAGMLVLMGGGMAALRRRRG